MSKKAEIAALKAYPVEMTPLVYQDLIDQFGGKTEIDVNTYPRCIFQSGYEQAEEDLTLTWEDIRTICTLSVKVEIDLGREISDERHYGEVLKRFNETRSHDKQ